MVSRVLVEMGFLLALNPRDKNHGWALSLLKDAKDGKVQLYISPAAFIEVALVLRAKGFSDDVLAAVFEAMEQAILKYTRPYYLQLKPSHVVYAAKLRTKYPGLTFFDSIHAAIAILEKLIYGDLDETVRSVVEAETSLSKS